MIFPSLPQMKSVLLTHDTGRGVILLGGHMAAFSSASGVRTANTSDEPPSKKVAEGGLTSKSTALQEVQDRLTETEGLLRDSQKESQAQQSELAQFKEKNAEGRAQLLACRDQLSLLRDEKDKEVAEFLRQLINIKRVPPPLPRTVCILSSYFCAGSAACRPIWVILIGGGGGKTGSCCSPPNHYGGLWL